MHPEIERGLIKIRKATDGIEDIQKLKDSIKILLEKDISIKLNFLQKVDFSNVTQVKQVASLVLFENSPELKLAFGKNAKILEEAFKKHSINEDTRRQIGVILEEAVKAYSKQEKEIERKNKNSKHNDNAGLNR